MKSKLLVLALSMFCVSFLAANGTVDANKGKVLASATVEVKTDAPAVDADQKEVAAEELAKLEAAKKAKEAQEKSSCKECK